MSSINAGTRIIQSADNSGLLEFQSNGVSGLFVNSSGMYVKSLTTAQRTAFTGINGMLVYDTTANALFVFTATGWFPISTTAALNQRAIFGYGENGSVRVSITNLVSSTGVVATDTTGVGTARAFLAAAGYGGDKAIFGFGTVTGGTRSAITNLVSNAGVVATDTTGVGTARSELAAAGYGTDKAIFGFGYTPTLVAITNLVSNAGVVATDTAGVGTARFSLAAAGYGGDKAIFGFGNTSGVRTAVTNLVSNTGVVATDTAGWVLEKRL
jgi:hypothetical protein